MVYRIESSGPFLEPVDWGLPEKGVSPVCGHPVFYCPDGIAGVPGGEVVKRFEICSDCQCSRSVAVARGAGAEAYLADCERLALRPFDYDPDDYTEHEFWITYTTRGPAAAVAEALAHGYALSRPN